MSFARAVAASYFAESENGFWRWAEDGAVLVWQDGTTLAFREELIGILSRFTTGSPPPLEGLVLLLAACRGKVPTIDDVIGPPNGSSRAQGKRAVLAAHLAEVIETIRGYATLPGELLVGVEAKAELAWMVFEASRAEGAVPTREALRELAELVGRSELSQRRRSQETIEHLARLAAAIQGRGPDELRRRLRTGLDALPVPAPVDLPPAERWRRFWDELARHQELAGLAALARDAMAALRLPRRLGVPDTGALAGVADLSNRGSLDRLLLSELAHDDEVLTSRLALNEALYLRREPPAMEPPGSLAVLLDSGVRMWGLPRVFAVAVALAAAQKEAGRRSTRFWRAHGEQVVLVDLDVVAGLEAHLGVLETGVHPGASLAAFDAASSDGGDSRMVLVLTHRDFLSDPEFRRALAETPALEGFLGVVDRDGHFALHKLPLAQRAPYCEARLDLGGLLADAEAGRSLAAGLSEKDLPAIFRVRPFPLLLPATRKTESFWPHTGGMAAVTKDHRLLAWECGRATRATGARQLAAGLPRGQTLWLQPEFDPDLRMKGALLFVHHSKRSRLWLVRVGGEGREPESVRLPCEGTRQPFLRIEREVALIISPAETLAVALTSGQVLGRRPVPMGWRLMHGRFYAGASGWGFVAWGGEGIEWLPLDLPREVASGEVLFLCDPPSGMDGCPYLVTRSGQVLSAEGRRVFDAKQRVLQARLSRDGARLLLQSEHPDRQAIVDLRTGEGGFHSTASVQGRLNPVPELPTRRPIVQIASVCVVWPEEILLKGVDGSFWRLRILNGVAILLEASRTGPSSAEGLVPFVPMESPPHLGCRLDLVQFSSGTRIFHDSRGLLHLKSRNAKVPDLTLVLTEGMVEGWVEGLPSRLGEQPSPYAGGHPHTGAFFEAFLRAE